MEGDSDTATNESKRQEEISSAPPSGSSPQLGDVVVTTTTTTPHAADLDEEETEEGEDLGLVLPYLESKSTEESVDLSKMTPLHLSSRTSNNNDDSLASSSNHTAMSASSTSVQATDLLVFSDTETSQNPDNNLSSTLVFDPAAAAVMTSTLVTSGTTTPPSSAATTATSTTTDFACLEDSNHATALNFVMEHRVFLRSALMLLAERDKQAPELGMMDPIVLKAGPLKKAAHLMNGVWRVKFVEVRRGMFSYYENIVSKDVTTGERELLRKNIPLTASTCTCRPVKLHQKALNLTALGSIFELSSGGGNKRLWMANSREERHRWMHAIQHAMVGGSVTRGAEDFSTKNRNVTAWKDDSRQYTKTQSILRNAKTTTEYVAGLRELLHHSLQVPVKWVTTKQSSDASAAVAFREETIDMSVDQLWRDMKRDQVRINGTICDGGSGHGPERIVGALMRCILAVSRSSAIRSLSESQALAYARDALLAGNRTRTGGDSYFCMNSLCRNDDLVVIVPSGREAEPVTFEVSEDESDHSFHSRLDNKSGWIKTRNLLNRSWKRRYFVLCEGTLSYYEGSHPRPHGLKGQMFLKEAVFSFKKRQQAGQFVLSITVNEGTAPLRETLLLFESEDDLIDWIYALECTTKSKINATSNKKTQRRRGSGSKSGSAQPDPNSFTDLLTLAQHATLEHAAALGIDASLVVSRLERISRRTSSAVRVSLRACTEYKICTTDPQGVEDLDTWATVRTHFLQTMRATGGPNGRITRGEESVRISVVDCLDTGAEQDIHEPPPSPSRRGRSMQRLFRNISTDGPSLDESAMAGTTETP